MMKIINHWFILVTYFMRNIFYTLFISLLLCTYTVKANDAQYIFKHETLLKEKLDKGLQRENLTTGLYIVFFKETTPSPAPQHDIGSPHSKVPRRQQLIALQRDNILSTLKGLVEPSYQVMETYQSIPAMIIEATPQVIDQLVSSPYVISIGLVDSQGGAHLNEAIPQSNIDLVKAVSLSGKGVDVAIIDSGLNHDHPDFIDRVISQVCFSTDCERSIYDLNGHGTNVTGILAGIGSIAPQGGAPEVNLHIIKILDANNRFNSSSQILAALDHLLTNLPQVAIVNMSVGTDERFNHACDNQYSWTRSAAFAVNKLFDNDVMIFASSGNDSDPNAITFPACLENVIAVGATWDTEVSSYFGFCDEQNPQAENITCFTNLSDNLEIVAPGAMTTATGLAHGISSYAGTSMASPLVASCAALLRQYKPALSAQQIRYALIEQSGKQAVDPTNANRSFAALDCWQSMQYLDAQTQPIMTIIAPKSPLFTQHTRIEFSLSARDYYDVDLSSQVTWSIDAVDTGFLGDNFTHEFIEGNYTVLARVTDSSGSQASLKWDITVELASATISVTTPNNHAEYISNEDIVFSAVATDPRDGDISDRIVWFMQNIELGQGRSYSQSFAAGNYSIEARVLDSNNNQQLAHVNIRVVEPSQFESSANNANSSNNSGGAIGGFFLLLLLFNRSLIKASKTRGSHC